MFKLILLLFVVFSIAAVGSDSARQVYYQTDSLTPANIVPTFENGHLVVYDLKSASVYAPDGSLAYGIPVSENGYIPNVAVDTNRTAAAAVDHGGSRGEISIFDQNGLQVRLIDTGPFLPSFVCFAPDHSIWSTGTLARQSLTEKPEFFILRHFSFDGKELGAFLPRSSFKNDGEPAAAIIGTSGLRVANNRIGALLSYGGNGSKALWVEADLNGKEIGRWRVDIDGQPAAFTASGAIYAQEVGRIWLLDHATGKWNPASIQSDGLLVAADGEALVYMIRGTPSLRWVPVNRY